MNIHLIIEGNQVPGLTSDDISKMFRSRRITGDELCWIEGMSEWKPLKLVMPSIFPPQPPPPPPPLPSTQANSWPNTADAAATPKFLGVAGGKRSKTQARILAFWLGSFGAHKFYHKSWGWGIIYLLSLPLVVFICFPFTPVIALIESIMLHTMKEEEYNLKYNIKPDHPFKW